MPAKFTLQLTGLALIVLLVSGTAVYYLSHPSKRGQDERGFFEHHNRQFHSRDHQ